MKNSRVHCGRILLLICVAMSGAISHIDAAQLLVADRITNRVLRYDNGGNFLGVVLEDSTNLSEPNGLALSPDRSQLFVTSRQNSAVVRYDYDGTSAANPTVIVSSGIQVPASILFDNANDIFYVANLGFMFDGATVSRFTPDGTSAGADLTGGSATGRTGLAWAPGGELLASSFQSGEILKYNAVAGEFENFIGPEASLAGAGNLLVTGNDLYVTAGFSGGVFKFDATTGAPDPAFTPILGLEFPASISLAPDGNSLLVGVLGLEDGEGRIDQFAFDGSPLGTFAPNSSSDPSQGFVEATGLLIDPGTPTGFAADFNNDGMVDGADLTEWEAAFGATPDADANGDGISDGADFLIWQREFGSGVASAMNVVPEPSALVLIGLGLSCAIGFRRPTGA